MPHRTIPVDNCHLPRLPGRRTRDGYSQLLGAQPYTDGAYYVGSKVGGQEVGLDPHGHKGMTGPVGYCMWTTSTPA